MDLDAWAFPFLAGVFGVLIGSFLNVCIYRLPRDLSVVSPRSQCPHCQYAVRAWDNIPVFSYLILRGRCRDCGAVIPWRYPAVELATGLLFGWFVARYGLTTLALRNCVLAALLLALIFTDLETRLLPEQLTVGGIVLGFIFAWFVPIDDGSARLLGLTGRIASMLDATLGAAIPAALLWLAGWVFERLRDKQGLGFGDVVMLSTIGAFLGLRADFLALVLASFAGSVAGLTYVLMKREDPNTYELPLGSFLGAAGIVATLWGGAFMQWYGSLF